MAKVLRPPGSFRRSRSVLRAAFSVISVYEDWMIHLARLRQMELRRELLMQHQLDMQRVYGDYAMERDFGILQEYDAPRRYQYASSGSSCDVSEADEEKSDEEDDEDEDPVHFTELPLREEEDAVDELRHFIQRQTQRAEMENAYNQRFQLPDAFDSAQGERSFTPAQFEDAPPVTQLSPRRRQY